MTPAQGGPFRLIHSGAVRQRVRGIIQRALERGIEEDVRDELNAIQQRLATDPSSWGEECGDLPFLRLDHRHKLLTIFCVRFAVDPVRRLVYVLDYTASRAYSFLDQP
jgi:hypothetical protein